MSVRSTLALTGAAALSLAIAIPAGGPAAAADSPATRAITAKHVPDQVLVGFAPGSAASDRAASRSALGASAERVSPLAADAELWTLPPGRSVEDAIATLSKNPNIRYAEPNYILETAATSNDPDYTNGGLWGMYGNTTSPANQFGSQAGEAWAAGATGTSTTHVVVIDEGIQGAHPDLAANTWINPNDAADGIDNDGNGYIDDVNGWDFAGNNNSVYDGTGDDHGTHVAGTIGAVGGNGQGVAGVNWDVTMISAKFLGATGGTTANAVKAVDYATGLKKSGINIVATSNSWGGGGFSQTLLDAIARGGEQNILFVAAAGNSGTNNDASASYPSNYNCRTGPSSFDCVVAVAATDSSGNLASFSQYGATTVDLGAPGVNVRSTLPSNTYGNYSGTSMATPHVSGAVALCASMSGQLRGAALKSALLSSTTATTSLGGKTLTGGRLNVGDLAPLCGSSTPPTPAPAIGSLSPSYGTIDTAVTINGSGFIGATGVTFNGTPATPFTVVSDSQITTRVPANATNGSVVVTTPAGPSNAVTFTITAPSVPRSLAAGNVTRYSARLTWIAPTSGPVTSYQYKRSTNEAWLSAGTSLSVTVSGLSRGTSYTYQVRAMNDAGPSTAAQVTFTTKR